MVHLVPNNGVTCIESTLSITEGQIEAIKANPDKVKSLESDLHILSTCYTTEDGNHISKIGHNVPEKCDAGEAISQIENKHRIYLRAVDSWITEPTESEEEESEKEESEEKCPEFIILIPVMIL